MSDHVKEWLQEVSERKETIVKLEAELSEARKQIAAKDAVLLEDKPFGIDPATHFLHADDGGAPDSCIFYVPRDELAEARAQLANRGLALEAAEEECVELRAQIAELKLKVKAAEFAQSCAAASEKDLREQVAAWVALFERRGELIFGREGD